MKITNKPDAINIEEDFLINELTIKENINLFSNNKEEFIMKSDIVDKNLNNYPSNMSKSKRKLIQILIVLMSKNNTIVLNNPFVDLSKKQRKQLIKILDNLSKTKKVTIKNNNDIKIKKCLISI